MLVSKIKEEHLTIDLIDKLLFQGLDDTGEPADCIVVLGSMKAATYRVPVAIAAYRAGRADKILLSGGKIRDFPTGRCTESSAGSSTKSCIWRKLTYHLQRRRISGSFHD